MKTRKQDSSGIEVSVRKKGADSVAIAENPNHNGIELRFNAEPSHELQSKLRAMGFRPSKSQSMWYGDNNIANKEFANEIQSILPISPDGPDLLLSPSFEAVKTNIEQKDFSFILITLKDGEIKSYIVFEPSKPKAEVIATQFAKQEFGETFVALAVKPRTQIREARVLFDEGKIIFPNGQKVPVRRESTIKGSLQATDEETSKETHETENDNRRELETVALQKLYRWATLQPDLSSKPSKLSRETFDAWLKENYPQLNSTSLDNMWRSHERVMKSFKRFEKRSTGKPLAQPYSSNYKKLMQIIPDLIKHIDEGKQSGKSAKDPKGGLMDLNFDYLGKDKKGNYLIALSHYFKQNGDMVPDPDMQIRILPEMGMIEAMTFQDQFGYKEVYPNKGDGKVYVYPKLKKDLNQFLSQWLTNIIRQGHKIDLTQEESEIEGIENSIDTFTDNSLTTPETRENPKQEFERFFTVDEEKEIIEQFLAQDFTRPFSAQEAFDKNLPVIDLAFRYTEPMEYFRDYIEIPRKKRIQELRDELKDLKAEKGTSTQKTSLKEQVEQLEAEMTYAEKLVYDEGLIFQDDLFAIILEKAKRKGYLKELERDELSNFRDYVLTNILDNRAIENYHTDPVQTVVNELIDEYFNSKEQSNIPDMKPSNASVLATPVDFKRGDTFLPNILVPAGTKEPFISQYFHLHDMKSLLKSDFPHLLKLNENNLSKASALEMFELMQMAHPTQHGIDVGRLDMLEEWEKRGKELFEQLGFPTNDNYPYVNLYTGYESVEALNDLLFDANKEGNEWWAVAEHYRPIADAEKALDIIGEQIKKKKSEQKEFLNPKTNKPKLEYKKQFGDIEYTIKHLEKSKSVVQDYMKTPSANAKMKKENKRDPLTNDNGVYTETTAGKNYERIVIPMPKGAKYQAEIRLAKTSKGDYKIGVSCDKDFGDGNSTSYAPSENGETYTTRKEAFLSALLEIQERLQYNIDTEDAILGNEDNKLKHLNMAMNALKEFAKENNVTLKDLSSGKNSSTKPPLKEAGIIKGLETAYWTEEDEDDESAKFVFDGIAFHALTLQERLLEEVKNKPLEKQIEIADLVSKEFNVMSLNDYKTNSGQTIRDGEVPLKKQVVYEYLFDLSNDIDFFNPQPKTTILGFLMDLLIDKQEILVDKPASLHPKESKTNAKPKKLSQLELNKSIEAFIDKKDKEKSFFNEEEKNYIRQYTGSGGLINQGASGRGILYEYYTTENVVKRMWDMAYHFGYNGGSILEPSVGTGNFLKYAPKGATVFGFETNHYSARIAQILYPNSHIHEKAFETLFFAGNVHLKDNFNHPPYSLVIGNPPYGEFSGKYAGMGEKKWTGAAQYEHYFTLRGLDLLKSGGLLIYIVPSNFLRGSSFINIAKKIASKCEGLDRYTLGTGIFKTTDIETDIIALRKI